jgi:hypothetical protein
MKAAMTLEEAAREASVSEKTLRRAIQAVDPAKFPPPLDAKRVGRGYRITDTALRSWIDSWPDA